MRRPHAGHTGAGILLAVATAAAVMSAQAARPAAVSPRDISGFWELSFDGRRVPAAQLAAGVTPAVLAAQARKDARAIRWCNFLGVPFAMGGPRPLDIRQGRREIVIQFETNATPRHLYLNRTAHVNADEFDPTTNGDSIARWDGDTLVVDTVGFGADKGVTAIPGGGFRTDRSHLVERYRLVNNGAVLSATFTWDDPRVFRTPHSYEFRYVRLPRDYEPRQRLGCDPFDPERTTFLAGAAPTPAARTAPNPARR